MLCRTAREDSVAAAAADVDADADAAPPSGGDGAAEPSAEPDRPSLL